MPELPDELDRAILRELQGDLPLVSEPYREVAERVGISQEELLQRLEVYLKRHWLRRIAGVLYHQRAGFRHNVMGAWRIPAERRKAAGAFMASLPRVSHCYERPEFPGWPYNLFTMMHGQTEAEVQETVEEIRRGVQPEAYLLLPTLREFKKTSMQYF